ncbi:histone-like nucleoid-structuring protein Lsr2 [Rothia halotolerans]|uniref:histone-like nucleoid-structuring protein Lsr2 n=1 Tax=Rothia halotolerans TaxID=405770 RepID=UPI00101DA2A7|nr:Lsr2 family protein [Rothia halotolerans]
MAQKVNIILTDDLDGGEANETVRFSLDGGQFEIDLSAENAEKLREAVAPFKASARKVTPNKNQRAPKSASSSSKNPDTPLIRQWAKENGYGVSDRGRIHEDIRAAYYAAQQG